MKYLFRFEEVPRETFEEMALQCITDTDPVGLLKKCNERQRDLKAGIRRLNWQHWTACYAGAYGIRLRPEFFVALLAEDYFMRRIYKASLDDLLRLALLIGTDADTNGPTYKRACNIAARLQPLFDAEIAPMEVLRRIEAAGGLNSLDVADVMTKDKAHDGDDGHKAGNVEIGDDKTSEDEEFGNKEDGGYRNNKPAAPTMPSRLPDRRGSSGRGWSRPSQHSAQSKLITATSDQQTREVGEGKEILEVEMTEEMLGKVLTASHAFLHVERVGSGAGWQRIVCCTVAAN